MVGPRLAQPGVLSLRRLFGSWSRGASLFEVLRLFGGCPNFEGWPLRVPHARFVSVGLLPLCLCIRGTGLPAAGRFARSGGL